MRKILLTYILSGFLFCNYSNLENHILDRFIAGSLHYHGINNPYLSDFLSQHNTYIIDKYKKDCKWGYFISFEQVDTKLIGVGGVVWTF